jgi:YcaO-like protein with predicted kinase domain
LSSGVQPAAARSVPPETTLLRLAPHLAGLGITRVANITGLDRIGIPVYVAMRPNARSLSVSQGKGLDAAAAKASAICESLETQHAEYDDCLVRLETYERMQRRLPTVRPEQLPLARRSSYAPARPLPWTEGVDLLGDEPVWVPYELVHANACLPRVPGSGCFVCSTNGLAAGNTLAEAIVHGLCEVVERDACALWERSSPQQRAATQLDLDSIDDPACRELLARLDDAGVDVLLWDVTSDLSLPVYRAIIVDRQTDPVLAPIPGAFGAGCHPVPAVALSRTLTEAAQSRLTIIAGARDDLTRERYRAVQAADALRSYRELAEAWRGVVEFRSLSGVSRGTVEGELDWCLEAIAASGVEQVVVVDLSRDELPICVARTIVPGLEGPSESPSYRAGSRARARAV